MDLFWLHCSTQAFSGCGLQFLLAVAPLVAEPGLSSCGAPKLSCPEASGIFPDQGWNPCPLHWQEDSFLIVTFNFVLVRSDQISRSVVSDSLQPHESQHARPPCPSPTPGVHSDSHPSSQWCHPAIYPLSSPSPPATNPSQHQSFFQ